MTATTVDNSGAVAVAPLVPLLPYQLRRVDCESRWTWNCWSRQTGKSFTFALRRLLRGMKRNRLQIILSAGERQSKEVMVKVRTHVKAIRRVADCSVSDIQESYFQGTEFKQLEIRVRAANGSFDFRIIGLPANPDTARGFTGDVFLDEFGIHKDSREIWAAMFPILTRGNGECDICSTPKGLKNMFATLRGNRQFDQDVVTIEDAAAQGLDVDIDVLREGMNDELLWRQEFLCEFLDEASAFLTHEMITGCQDARLDKAWNAEKSAACAGEELYVGVDIGRYRDLTVIWIWGRPAGTNLLLTRGVIELAGARFAVQEDVLYRILGQRNAKRCAIDATGIGEQFAERARERFGDHRVESVKFTSDSKNDMATGLRVRVEDATARIPIDPDIRNDWSSIERQVLPGGSLRYLADRGSGGTPGHADRFWAAALGVRAASQKAYVQPRFEPVGPLTFNVKGLW
ncbi:MAG: terminase family protein [Planctomycetota bacterium]